ncbi:MAG: polyprenyl synthetase family protein [Chloroflexi bacterium]|nr:polyprenyl synthetase family protein [Chloroflexota bacterium]
MTDSSIKNIYRPIDEDLPRVERILQATANVELDLLGGILSYILNSKGKLLRPALTLLSGKFFNYDLDLLTPMAAGVELLHTATLVHDDTIDNARFRRGKATANSRWDGEMAILAGDYLFAKSADLVASTAHLRVIRLFAHTLMVICEGEMRQQQSLGEWRQTREDYFKRISGKTASLFGTAMESGALLSGAPVDVTESLSNYGFHLGMAFQIVDDILDVTGEEGQMGKPTGSDLKQGTITLPALLLMERYPDDNPIRAIWENGLDDGEQYAGQALEMIRNSTIIQDSYDLASSYCDAARGLLLSLPAVPSRDSLLALTDYVLDRVR